MLLGRALPPLFRTVVMPPPLLFLAFWLVLGTPWATAFAVEPSTRGPTDEPLPTSRGFTAGFRAEFYELMHWRRDVRHFSTEWDRDKDEPVLQSTLGSSFSSAPSVGLSEPWRVVRVESQEARAKVLRNFQEENAKALEGYRGEQKRNYATLKLSGMKEAPVQLAVFCDESTTKGSRLGAKSMPEMRRYSVVSAITLFWLAARAVGLGVGWVSILDPMKLGEDLEVSSDWTLVGYLCVGWPKEDNETPELERLGWEKRNNPKEDLVVKSV